MRKPLPTRARTPILNLCRGSPLPALSPPCGERVVPQSRDRESGGSGGSTHRSSLQLMISMIRFTNLLSRVLLLLLAAAGLAATSKPNIVLIYSDDVGYGDVGCYGATRVKTPNIDKLARGGLRFTDAHSPSATCTPSRYALLTGEYAWRRKGTGVLPGDAKLIVAPGRETIPSLLRRAGYATGCVGKWHLGLGDGALDWNGEIKPGPLETGFDYEIGRASCRERV